MNSFVFILYIFISLLAVVFVLVELLAKPSLKHIFFGLISVILGLLVGSLLADPLSKLPGLFGEYLPLAVSVVFAVGGLLLYRKFLPTVDDWGVGFIQAIKHLASFATPEASMITPSEMVIIDSSALIDGRVVEIIRLGFLHQKIVIPRFIVRELQNIADSKDHDRREKGRRGLEAVEKIKKITTGRFEVAKEELKEIGEVDHRLIELSKRNGAALITTDFNLNKVAVAEGVRILNINELAQALRPNLLPGEAFSVKLVHVGKDKTQGVGYLEDGTMIVVEGAGRLLGKEVEIKITRTLQTAAGKMYFAKVDNGKD
jgi:uncharacterized protein YacL